MCNDGRVVVMAAKIVDNSFICGGDHHVSQIIDAMAFRFKLGAIVDDPRALRYFELNVVHGYRSMEVDGDETFGPYRGKFYAIADAKLALPLLMWRAAPFRLSIRLSSGFLSRSL